MAIAFHTHALPAHVVARGILCVQIGIWLPFESRTNFAYCAILEFDISGSQTQTHGGDDYTEFGAPGLAIICCHCTNTNGPLASTDGSQASASSASLVAQPVSARWHHRPTTTTTTHTTSTDASASQPAKKNTRGVCRQLKTAKVTRVTNSRINIGYNERHRAAPMAELHSSLAHDIGHIVRTHCPMQWKSWKVMLDEIKTETNYNLEDLDDESLAYVNRLFSERRVARSSLRGGRIVGRGSALIFRCPILWKNKTLLHHLGSRPFSYRMDARQRGGSKFPKIDVFGNVYVRPGNELAKSLHMTMVGGSQLVLQESASQLPPNTSIESVDPPQDAGFQILTETLDQTLRRRPGTYCRGMGNARWREP
ncbi:unnamed protein product [Prunus armeniaca]